MRLTDKAANRAAAFHPYRSEKNNSGTEALPCIEIGGVQVYAYVRDGILVISADFGTADAGEDSPFALFGSDQVPVVVSVGGQRAYEDFPEDWVSEDDARALRKAGEDQGWVLPGWAAEQWS